MELPTEMYRNYVTRREDDLNQLTVALKILDVSVFRRVGHQLRGNATSFGFNELLNLANDLHEVNTENISQTGPRIISQLQTWIVENKKKYDLA